MNKESCNAFGFSKRGQSLLGQEMFKVLDRASELERNGKTIYHLELGSPKNYPPGRIINKTIQALLETKVGYTSSGGLPDLRQRIASYFANAYPQVTVKNVAISTANLLIFQLIDIICDPGDEVTLFLPAFPTYFAACNYAQMRINSVGLDSAQGFILGKKDIDHAFESKPKLVFINSANNPSGAVYDKNVLAYLIDKARQHRTWVISDETYASLAYNKEYISMLGFSYERLAVISSFSKIFSVPGFRVGYAIAHESVIEKLSLSSSTLYSCLPIFTQQGLIEGFSIFDEFSDFMKKKYRIACRECLRILSKAKKISFTVPDSAFYIFINIGNLGLSDIQFCKSLLDTQGVAVTPGSSFGCPEYIRVAFCGDTKELKKGLTKLVHFINNL